MIYKTRTYLLIFIFFGLAANARSQQLAPDNPESAMALLEQNREALLSDETINLAEKTQQALALGLWDLADSLLAAHKEDEAFWEPRVRYHLLNNAFGEAETLVSTLLAQKPEDRLARLYRSQLEIEAWELKKAERTCLDLLKNNSQDETVVLQLGRIYMQQRNYPKALALAEQVIDWNNKNAAAYLLAAEVQFWLRNSEEAESFLEECLKIDPFNADARFYYGYAIWRRVDATQLPDMAAQWELALAVNPLHYLTHWHWGNGHTHLTFADYVDSDEAEIRAALASADSLISSNQIDSAINICRAIEGTYFASVLPSMMIGSAFYMAYDKPLMARMDSAQAIFQNVLHKKPHYGPAHNGIAAVIKQKRFPYLASYDSLQKVISETEISDPENFSEVFADMGSFPGDRVPKMIWNQLHTSVVYFPFLAAQEKEFVIPALHVDLATAMKSPFFRGATTFDNRQWMDIRGVGSGATAIEYVERGAHQERNVTLHEYVHLFHGNVFTDQEFRRVRALYYHAMENDLTLDYYSANNEFEYLAQTYTAYFIPIKVHPLNHKSINTRGELKRKDPQLFAFLDSLVQKQQAYLAGDSGAMADNWAQVYLNLAEKADNPPQKRALLDKALAWDSTYLPAILQYAKVAAEARQFNTAQEWISRAEGLEPNYAPIYIAKANRIRKLLQANQIEPEQAVQEISMWYERALRLEKDYSEQARFNSQYRETMRDLGYIQEAVAIAESYAAAAPTISTYLRDRKAAAEAFAWELKGQLGYLEGAQAFFKELIAQKPQQYYHRAQYAKVLLANQRYEELIELLEEAQRILEAAGTPRSDFTAMMAKAYLSLGEREKALTLLEPISEGVLAEQGDPYLWVKLYLQLEQLERANKKFLETRFPKMPYEQSNYYLVKGILAEQSGDRLTARESYTQSLEANSYNLEARIKLLELFQSAGERRQIRRIATRATVLPIPPGPEMLPKIRVFLE
ncbi:MAG: tetratricopeptide repeat protein [Bacteroidota bacterium]